MDLATAAPTPQQGKTNTKNHRTCRTRADYQSQCRDQTITHQRRRCRASHHMGPPSPAGQLPAAMTCVSSPQGVAEGIKIFKATPQRREATPDAARRPTQTSLGFHPKILNRGSKAEEDSTAASPTRKRRPQAPTLLAGKSGQAFARSFRTTSSRHRDEPVRISTGSHTLDARQRQRHVEATTHLVADEPDPAAKIR
jgi:hypothetical protein